MDEQRKAEIRERLSKATPGPWGHFVAEWRPATPVAVHRIGSNETGEDIACVYLTRPSDADLIAHAPTDLADLLSELDRTTADLAVAAEVARERGQEVERLRKVAEAAAGFCLYAYGNDRSGELAAYDRLTEAIDALNAYETSGGTR